MIGIEDLIRFISRDLRTDLSSIAAKEAKRIIYSGCAEDGVSCVLQYELAEVSPEFSSSTARMSDTALSRADFGRLQANSP